MKVRTYVADWLGVLLMSEAKLVTQLPSMNDHLCSDLFQFMVLCSVACSYVFCMDLVWVSVSVVVIITKISEGEQCFVFHLREDVYAPHCAREMRGVQQSGVHCCHDGSIWLFNLYAIYVWFHIFT